MSSQERVVGRMLEQVQRWEAAEDRRAIFLACYSVMTKNMLASINGDVFQDPAWVYGLLEKFAEY